MIRTNQAFKDSLDSDIQQLDKAMMLPFAEVVPEVFEHEFLQREADRLLKRAQRLQDAPEVETER